MTGAVEPTIAGPELVVSATDTPSTTAPPPVSAPPAPALPQQPKPSSYPQARIPLVDRHIDEPRAVRVAVIGAGLSGILAGALLPAKVPGIKLTIYEKNTDVSGTWFENVYPGVRCDIPSHVYQSTFEPNTQWSDEFSYGAEIRDYWQSVARKHNVYDLVKLQHRVQDLLWDENASVWKVTVTNLATNSTFVEDADFVITALGRFNAWRLPNIPGRDSYRGLLRHASNWDPTFDPAGKRVAVIGNGASGIQVVANLQRSVARLDHYARSKTWIAASVSGDERSSLPQPYTDEQKATFAAEPETYLAFRKEMEDRYWRNLDSWFKGTNESKDMASTFSDVMKRRLAKKPQLADALVPDFSPNCRRLTPGPGYLEALTEDNVELIQVGIKRFTETGIETTDGVLREVDAIICATGANVDMVPPFRIHARGRNLSDLWARDGEHGFPYTYLGIATPGFPNLFFLQGPHGTGSAGTVPHAAETQITYMAKALRKASREGIRTMAPTKQAADDFVDYSDAFFNTTVLAENCSSWYNGGLPGARIHGIWPGTAWHLSVARQNPRWEDWQYEYLGPQGNRFAWFFGNGKTRREYDETSDCTPYLRAADQVDLRRVHEDWWE
ncbi:putative sterigmatocystin biosynthesis monooxygenase stcW [Ceratocystis lukuohia]|uniref:Sterigmatocystin biosynthesis monooxygenase stcW n=1 Tax=Ceratocystis lukuohia TaxID=2019550 RepID=A0ABR4MMS9_9PEZI